MSTDTDRIRKSLNEAARSWDNFMSAMMVFNANTQRASFTDAEAEREKMHVLLDDYLDQYSIAGHMTHSLNGKLK